METNRETKKITTPAGKELELKTYITARERNQIRDMFYKNMKLENVGGKPEMSELSGEIMSQAEYKLIESVVVSYDGNKENVLDRISDEKPEEYDFIVEEINKIPGTSFTPAK